MAYIWCEPGPVQNCGLSNNKCQGPMDCNALSVVHVSGPDPDTVPRACDSQLILLCAIGLGAAPPLGTAIGGYTPHQRGRSDRKWTRIAMSSSGSRLRADFWLVWVLYKCEGGWDAGLGAFPPSGCDFRLGKPAHSI
jgi:hypothetical protein